jgi:hypothetical protein
MKTSAILFILSIIGISLLFFLSFSTPEKGEGTIIKIEQGENKIAITVDSIKEEIILFENNPLFLEKGDKISVEGKIEGYQSKSQFVVDKITLHDS